MAVAGQQLSRKVSLTYEGQESGEMVRAVVSVSLSTRVEPRIKGVFRSDLQGALTSLVHELGDRYLMLLQERDFFEAEASRWQFTAERAAVPTGPSYEDLRRQVEHLKNDRARLMSQLTALVGGVQRLTESIKED